MSSPDITPLNAVCVLQAADTKCSKSVLCCLPRLCQSVTMLSASCSACAWAVIIANSQARSGRCSYNYHPQTSSAKFYGPDEPESAPRT